MSAKTTAGGREGETDEGPLRLCAVTRAQKSPDDLIRFVLGPDSAVVPDLARRLPGRGLWVDATRAAVAEAVSRKVFAKGFKVSVTVPDDLPGLIGQLMAKRLAGAVAIANKAGLLVAGFGKVEEMLDRGRAAVLIHATDAAADGAGKLDRKFKALIGPEGAGGATICELSSAELSLAIGRPNVIHAAASEGGASQRMLEAAHRLKRYRQSDAAGEGPQRDTISNTG